MEVRIGVQHTAREIVLESDEAPDDVLAKVHAALTDGGVLTLTDDRGRQVFVPADRLAYVEVGAPSSRRVGFGSP